MQAVCRLSQPRSSSTWSSIRNTSNVHSTMREVHHDLGRHNIEGSSLIDGHWYLYSGTTPAVSSGCRPDPSQVVGRLRSLLSLLSGCRPDPSEVVGRLRKLSGTIAGSMRLQLGDDLIVRLHDHRILRGLRLHEHRRDSCVGFAPMNTAGIAAWAWPP